jgi:hypothetical protein
MSLPKPDPSLPSGSSPIFQSVSAVRGDQLRANNGDIWDNFEYLAPGIVPVGAVISWLPGYFTDGDNAGFTPVSITLDDNWVECDGSAPNDSDSPIFNAAGRHIPNLTDDRFLFGSNDEDDGSFAIGGIGGANNNTATYPNHHHVTLKGDNSPAGIFAYDAGGSLTQVAAQITTQTGTAPNQQWYVYAVESLKYTAIDGGGNITFTNNSGSNTNLPKYLSCRYIIRIK